MIHEVAARSHQSLAPVADHAASGRTEPRPLQTAYDFIVCGAGTSGSVVARRLAEDPDVSVLLLEAGGTDDVPEVQEAKRWQSNLGSERDWAFESEANPGLNGRTIRMSMGKVLGGGSSINVGYWAHGHRSDWEFFAQESGEPLWNYDNTRELYRRLESWQGPADPVRGVDGPLYVRASEAGFTAPSVIDAAQSLGVPFFPSLNGSMVETSGGCSYVEQRIQGGRRLSVFRDYVYPIRDNANLTVLTGALVERVVLDGLRATGVRFCYEGRHHIVNAGCEVVLCLGAINTPRVLMQSGIGDEAELNRAGLPVVQHLPGVGRDLQDHLILLGCVWERADTDEAVPPQPGLSFSWKSDPGLESPDLLCVQLDGSVAGPALAGPDLPKNGFTMAPGVVRLHSRGSVHLTGSRPEDPLRIEANYLTEPEDLKAMLAAIELCRELAASRPLQRLLKREAIPGNAKGKELETFVRNSVGTYWHQSCTAKMGRDSNSVVDGQLRVYGIDNLRVADASIMPRITAGNTMAPCVVIGERAAELLRSS